MKSLPLLLATLLIPAIEVSAQAPATNGWVSLFNGRDLNGWKIFGAERWVVEDGMILGQTTTGKYGYLLTEKTFRDFILRVRFKGEPGGNSGVFLRCRITGESPKTGPDIEAMQVEVDPAPGNHTGGLYESGGRGWLIQPTTEGERSLKVGDWNELEIAADGRHVVTRLNSTQIVDFWDSAPRFLEGAIGLQVHTGGDVKVWWKDIQIQEILTPRGQ